MVAVTRAGGFTLVELLVVMLIIGLLAGVLTTTLAMSRVDSLQQEAERLAWLLQETGVRARAEAVNYDWRPNGEGYVLRRDAAEANETAHRLAAGVRVLRVQNDEVEATALRIAPRGVGTAVRITLASGERRIDVIAEGLGLYSVGTLQGGSDARR